MKNIIACFFVIAASLQAGELVPSRIPASAKWFLHADVDAMRGSETGKAIFGRIEEEYGAQLRALKRMFSIHPTKDLNDVTLFGDGLPDHAVALIHGTFDRDHIADVLKAAENYSESQHAGITVMSWTDKEKIQNAAFVENGLVAFSGQMDLLKQGLDVLKANQAVTADPFFTMAGGKPLVSGNADLSGIKLPEDASVILRMAHRLRIAANEDGGRFIVRLGVESTDAKEATRLHRILDGVVAFSQVVNKDLSELDLRSEITVTRDKPGVSANLSLPVPEWLALMEKDAARKRAEAAAKK